MKNVKENQLKKCIFMEFEEFQILIGTITDGLVTVKCDFEGLWYEDTDKAEETDIYWNEDIQETLSKYYDVEITSVHIDDCDYAGVWICYK